MTSNSLIRQGHSQLVHLTCDSQGAGHRVRVGRSGDAMDGEAPVGGGQGHPQKCAATGSTKEEGTWGWEKSREERGLGGTAAGCLWQQDRWKRCSLSP